MDHKSGLAFAGVLIVVVMVMVGAFYLANGNNQVQMCTVTDKDRTRTSEGSDMRVYTEDCGTLRVGDSLVQGVFDSADIYAQINPGEVYQFETVGHRIPILSRFPQIIEVKSVV